MLSAYSMSTVKVSLKIMLKPQTGFAKLPNKDMQMLNSILAFATKMATV
jgi:hypothetical protein